MYLPNLRRHTHHSSSASTSKINYNGQDESTQSSQASNIEQIETNTISSTEYSLKRSFTAISSTEPTNDSMINKKLRDHNFLSENNQSILNSDENSFESYQVRVAHAIGVDYGKRILGFLPSAPFPNVLDISKNAYQPKLNTHTLHVKRRISIIPEKTLDAPYLADDYYHNVLDWSSTNVVALALDKAVYLWNADNGTIQALNYNNDDQVASVSWSSDGSYLAVGTTKGDLQVWDAQSNKKLRSMSGQNCRIGVLGWNKFSVTSGGQDGSIFSHDVRMADHVVRQLYGHAEEVCGLKYRWDGELLATGGNDNTVNIWDARSSNPKYQKRVHKGAVKALAWCPWNHNTLATGGGRDDGNIHFWNTSSGLRVNTIRSGSQVTSLTWSQHYQEIASTHGYPYNQVSVWAYPSLSRIIDIPAHDSRILYSAISPDGQHLATAAADQNLKIWRIFETHGKSRLTSQNIQFPEKNQSTPPSFLKSLR